jgi:DNA polymerase iota
LLPQRPQVGSEQTFQVDPPNAPSPRSFTYTFGSYTGFLEPACETKSLSSAVSYATLQLFVASHFAQYIRAEICGSLGYTTSAGVASTKLVAKLLSDLHKPALQSIQNPWANPEEREEWLDNFKVEKLNGFGFRTGWILRHHIFGEEMPAKGVHGDPDKVNGSFFEEAVAEEEEMLVDAEANKPAATGGLTVGKVRTCTSADDFYAWFGGRLGPRLWGLLQGMDDAEVIPTPAFPKQISVEDSYPDNHSMTTLLNGVATLTKSLVRRLDLDLEMGDAYVRFPKTLRLTLRNGWQVSRESKSTRMPVELFDLTLNTEKRVEMVTRATSTLAKSMVALWPPGWKVGIINVAATDLGEEMPGRGIQGFIDKPRREEELDWDMISQLPDDIRTEVMKQYHLSPEKLDAMAMGRRDEDVEMDDGDDWDDGDDEDIEDTKEKCDICGARIYSWMSEAHARYHDSLS